MNKKSVLAQRTLLASIIFLLIAALCVVAFADYTELNISPVKQEKSNWCWVAAGQMAGSYINPSVHRSQSEICSHVKGNTNDSTGSYLEAASAMAYAAGNSRRAGGSLVRWSWSQVIEAINKGYPVVLLASDNLIDGHFYLMRAEGSATIISVLSIPIRMQMAPPSRSGKPLLTFRMPRIARKRSNTRNRLELL